MYHIAAHHAVQNIVKLAGRTAAKFNCIQIRAQYKSKHEQLFFSTHKRCVKGTFIERLIGSENKAHFERAIKLVSITFSMRRR